MYSNICTFTKSITQATKLSIPRGRRKDYKPYWNQRLEDLHKELDTGTTRDALEKQPTEFTRQVHKKKAKNLYGMEKHSQRQRNWFEKTSSLNMKKDTQKLSQNQSKKIERKKKKKAVFLEDHGSSEKV